LERAVEVVSAENHFDIPILGLNGYFRHMGKVMPKHIKILIATKKIPGTIRKFHDHIYNGLCEFTKQVR
jgi:hypothetical protein